MKLRIPVDKKAVVQFCQRWKITELSFFGSVLRKNFRRDSDVDVLVAFSRDARWGLFDHVRMQHELSAILGHSVDLVSKRAVEQSHNWIRKQSILESTEVYYAA